VKQLKEESGYCHSGSLKEATAISREAKLLKRYP